MIVCRRRLLIIGCGWLGLVTMGGCASIGRQKHELFERFRVSSAQAVADMIAVAGAEAQASDWHIDEKDLETARAHGFQLLGNQPFQLEAPMGALLGAVGARRSGAFFFSIGAQAEIDTSPIEGSSRADLALKVEVALALRSIGAEEAEIEAARGVVVLHGVVPTVKARLKAEERIWDVKGVMQLTNALRVKERGGP